MGLYALGTTWYHELIDTLWNVNKQKKYNKRKWKGN